MFRTIELPDSTFRTSIPWQLQPMHDSYTVEVSITAARGYGGNVSGAAVFENHGDICRYLYAPQL